MTGRPDPGGGRGQGVDVLRVPVDAEQPGLGGRHPHDDVEPGVGAHPVVGVGQAAGQGRHVTPLPGEDGDAVEQLLEVAHRRARQASGSPASVVRLAAVRGLAVVLQRDLVGRGDALGQVDGHLRPGEPLLGRQVPADPEREQRAAGEDRRVVDGLPREVVVERVARRRERQDEVDATTEVRRSRRWRSGAIHFHLVPRFHLPCLKASPARQRRKIGISEGEVQADRPPSRRPRRRRSAR